MQDQVLERVQKGVHHPKVAPGEEGQEGGDVVDIVFDCVQFELAAVDTMASGQMDCIHSELELPSLEGEGRILEEEVVVPFHITGEFEVMEATGTNCPSTVGRTQGPTTGPENSFE